MAHAGIGDVVVYSTSTVVVHQHTQLANPATAVHSVSRFLLPARQRQLPQPRHGRARAHYAAVVCTRDPEFRVSQPTCRAGFGKHEPLCTFRRSAPCTPSTNRHHCTDGLCQITIRRDQGSLTLTTLELCREKNGELNHYSMIFQPVSIAESSQRRC